MKRAREARIKYMNGAMDAFGASPFLTRRITLAFTNTARLRIGPSLIPGIEDQLGLHAPGKIAGGEIVCRLKRGGLVTYDEVVARRRALGKTRKALIAIALGASPHMKDEECTWLVDLDWTSCSTEPFWYFMNHADEENANVRMVLFGEHSVAWIATRDICDEELTFEYCPDCVFNEGSRRNRIARAPTPVSPASPVYPRSDSAFGSSSDTDTSA